MNHRQALVFDTKIYNFNDNHNAKEKEKDNVQRETTDLQTMNY